MRCVCSNSLSGIGFGAGAGSTSSMKNGQLNMGVVAPPDKLPNASIYNTIHQYDTPKAVISKSEGFSAGKLSAGCAVGALFLSLVSLLPVIRKH